MPLSAVSAFLFDAYLRVIGSPLSLYLQVDCWNPSFTSFLQIKAISFTYFGLVVSLLFFILGIKVSQSCRSPCSASVFFVPCFVLIHCSYDLFRNCYS